MIIGSGITGTSFARAILDYDYAACGTGNDVREKREGPPRVVMLEARDACSGATARNGGHISPVLYQDYIGLKEEFGKEMAMKIVRFRLAHLAELLKVAEEEGLLGDSQCRKVDAFDVYHDANLFRQAKAWLQEYQEDLPEESANYRVYERPEELAALQLSKSTVGCMSTVAGAVHPYRLVTGILTRLLNSYQSSFDLFTHTPCVGITTSPDDHGYIVETPRGSIRAAHVVHATNGWASHLLPGLRGKIFPARGVMTAQKAREGLGRMPDMESKSTWTGTRSFVFYPSSSVGEFDYLTQQRAGTGGDSYPPPHGELMLGGGFSQAVVADTGCGDDSDWTPAVGEHLRQALGAYFSVADDRNGEKEGQEEVEQTWSGILGISADERPWVGRIGPVITTRREGGEGGEGLAAGGEWIAAGYTGEGMVHAWMSGKALAGMVLGLDRDCGLPEVFIVSEERWRKAEFCRFVGSHIG